MKYFVTTFYGAEEIVKQEIKEKLKVNSIISKGFLILEKKEGLDSLKSIIRAGIFLKNFKFKTIKEFKKQISDIDFSFIKEEFAVECERLGSHKFSSVDIAIETASKIKAKVNLENPKILVYVKIRDEDCLIGVDLFKRRIDKRSYRIKPHPNALNSAIAYIALKFSNYNSSSSLLDPFCGSGIIPIEASLMKGKEVYGTDNQYYCIESTNINSKVAGVKINTLKVPVKDIKIRKKFDFIVTDPPIATFRGLNDIYNLYYEFLEKAFSLLKPKGKLVIITARPKPILEEPYKFKLEKSLVLDKNNLKYSILVFKK